LKAAIASLYGTACLTADWESNCLSWPIELVLAFQVLASKSKLLCVNHRF